MLSEKKKQKKTTQNLMENTKRAPVCRVREQWKSQKWGARVSKLSLIAAHLACAEWECGKVSRENNGKSLK